MIIPNSLMKLLSLISNKNMWVYLVIFVILFYLLISLLTWSFIKPLKYLGIPTIMVGLLFLIIRLLFGVIINTLKIDLSFLKVILPSILKPILINGLICAGLGILMIIGYIIINKSQNTKKI